LLPLLRIVILTVMTPTAISGNRTDDRHGAVVGERHGDLISLVSLHFRGNSVRYELGVGHGRHVLTTLVKYRLVPDPEESGPDPTIIKPLSSVCQT